MIKTLSLLLLACMAMTMLMGMEHEQHDLVPHSHSHSHSPRPISVGQGHQHHPIVIHSPKTEETTYLSSISSYLTTTTFYLAMAVYSLITLLPFLYKACLALLGMATKMWRFLANLLASMNKSAEEKKKDDKEKKKEEAQDQSEGHKKGGDDQGGACSCVCEATSDGLHQSLNPDYVAGLHMPLNPSPLSKPTDTLTTLTLPESETASYPTVHTESSVATESDVVVTEPVVVVTESNVATESVQEKETIDRVNPLPTDDQIASFTKMVQKNSAQLKTEHVAMPGLVLSASMNATKSSQSTFEPISDGTFTADPIPDESVHTTVPVSFMRFGANNNKTETYVAPQLPTLKEQALNSLRRKSFGTRLVRPTAGSESREVVTDAGNTHAYVMSSTATESQLNPASAPSVPAKSYGYITAALFVASQMVHSIMQQSSLKF